MIAGQPVNFGALTTVYQQAKTNPLPGIYNNPISEKVATSSSFVSASNIFGNILAGGELPETYRESVTTQNLLNLGQASKDISKALADVANGLQTQINQVKTALPTSITSVPEEQAPQKDGMTYLDKFKNGFTDFSNQLGITPATIALGVGGIVLLLLITRR